MRKTTIYHMILLILIGGGVAAQSPPAGQAEAVTASYIIGPNDLLSINVFKVPELNTTVRVAGDGTIALPLLGTIRVEGMNQNQLEKKLAAMLDERYLQNAQVSVFIREYKSKTVSVVGAVTRPGDYELLGKKNLLQVISMAGGVTNLASGQVVVIRSDKSEAIDLKELMIKGSQSLNVFLMPGDIVNIPFEEYLEVHVLGQVRNPGLVRLKMSGSCTLIKAIAQAGGFTEHARKSSILVSRPLESNEIKIKVDARKILRGRRSDFILKHGDVIHVPESLF
jgi:polysaccharide export outer membrane protein